MKITENDKSCFLSGKPHFLPLIPNRLLIFGLPQEKFEHWGFLVYSDIIAKLIRRSLVLPDKICKN